MQLAGASDDERRESTTTAPMEITQGPAINLSASVARPNIVLVLNDDQDYTLGGYKPMNQTLALIAKRGAFATNWFAHTPVCCPSRSQILSGRYFHNLRSSTPASPGCMHVQTGVKGQPDKVNQHSFASYLVRDAGYTAAWFGKHLNACPHEPPPGFDCPTCRWFTNGGGQDTEPGGFITANFNDFHGLQPANGTYSRNGTYWSWLPGAPVVGGLKQAQFAGYTTSIIANKSIEWLNRVAGPHATRVRHSVEQSTLATPFLLVVAPKAPHYAATPAPWYEHGTWVDGAKAPRTPSFGVDPHVLAHHHEQIAKQPILTDDEIHAIDRHFEKRWKSLLSVDDAVVGIAHTLDELKVAASTYFIVTSDHGYHLGQHNLPSCKLQVYDHAIRVPMMMRGPGIAPGSTFSELASHVDLAPTILALGGLDPRSVRGPPLDGQSLLPWLLQEGEQLGREHQHTPLVVAEAGDLPSATREQLAIDAGRLRTSNDGTWTLPAVRQALLIEFNSLGNVQVCGGGTCKGDRPDPFGYCHMPCFNLTCPPQVCANVTCCGEAGTEFSSLEGMRCGAGHAPGSLPFNTSDDPGHLCDSSESNTFRALRFVGPKVGNKLYAEFTRLSAWNFTAPDVFVEVFDLDTDPDQLVNLANRTPAAELARMRSEVHRLFECVGEDCVS